MSRLKRPFKITAYDSTKRSVSTFIVGTSKSDVISTMESTPAFVNMNGEVVKNASVVSYTIEDDAANLDTFKTFVEQYSDLLNGLRLDVHL